uniref:Uncharacterized protein n=1 Tax=Arundo donax TaxID=35708 RepID=A0A0A8YL48_ARUDO
MYEFACLLILYDYMHIEVPTYLPVSGAKRSYLTRLFIL